MPRMEPSTWSCRATGACSVLPLRVGPRTGVPLPSYVGAPRRCIRSVPMSPAPRVATVSQRSASFSCPSVLCASARIGPTTLREREREREAPAACGAPPRRPASDAPCASEIGGVALIAAYPITHKNNTPSKMTRQSIMISVGPKSKNSLSRCCC